MAALVLCTAMIMGTPAGAEVTDVRSWQSGERAHVWIAFLQQPRLVRMEDRPGLVRLELSNVRDVTRLISPSDNQWLAAVTLEPLPDGMLIDLTPSGAWTGLDVEVRQGGVLLSFSPSDSSAPRVSSQTLTIDPVPASHSDQIASMPGATPAPRPSVSDRVRTGPSSTAPQGSRVPTGTDRRTPARLTPSSGAASAVRSNEPAPASTPPARESSGTTPGSHIVNDLSDAAAAAERHVQATQDPASRVVDTCSEAASAVAADPWDDRLLEQHATCLVNAGELNAAAEIYAQILAFEPENYEAAVALAEILHSQGDVEGARNLYFQAAGHARSDFEAAQAREQARTLGQ
ncbi:tetratricopeptide repeat protein [Maricaulis sp. D1M11]